MADTKGSGDNVLSAEELQKENRVLKRKLALMEQNLSRAQSLNEAKNRVESTLVESQKKEQQYFQLVLENTNNILVLFDFDGRFAYASDTFLKAIDVMNFGLINGMHYNEVLPLHVSDDNLSEFSEAIEIMKAERKPVSFEQQIDFNRKGKLRSFSVSVIPMLDEKNNDTGIMVMLNDITEMNTALKEAEQANQAKSNFLATMSHEIRTPLNAIIGIAQIQLQKPDLPDDYAKAMERVYNSGDHLLSIINDILDLSKIETGNMELNEAEYSIPSLINDAAQLNVVRIGSKPISLILDIDENLPSRLIGDELRLKQILSNLISNAIKYTEKGYVKLTVTHSAETSGMQDVIMIFTIEDTGQGIKPEDQERLFAEYTRFNTETNRTTEGTGIGLRITKSLVDVMGGNIEVKSEFGKGSAFTVKVRQKTIECGAIGAEISQRLRNFTFTGRKQHVNTHILHELMPYGKVLIVDDVETNLFVAEGLLSPYKVSIETANSGYAAIEKVANGKVYDLIFMDHMMPLMDGIETTKKLRDMGYDGVIVALTANALAGNDMMFKKHGFDKFISKPIDVRHLNDVMNRYVRDRYPEEAAKYKEITASEAVRTDAVSSSNPNLIRAFLRDAEKAVVTLRETAVSGDLKLFTTTVHAMKAALANIGESEKSVMASELEDAGRDNDKEFIEAKTQSFIEALEMLIEKLSPTEEIDIKDIKEDTAFLTEQLLKIKTACENCDDTAAFSALDLLGEKQWSSETNDMLNKIRDMLFLDSDFDGVAEQIKIKEFKNYMEDVVIDNVHGVLEKMGGCKCYDCRMDIAAIALNELLPAYYISDEGAFFLKAKRGTSQSLSEVIEAITKGASIVMKNPRKQTCFRKTK